jgi:hypothetical protein
VRGRHQHIYLSHSGRFGFDQSYVEFSWQPDFTPDGAGGWRAVNDPEMDETTAGSAAGVGLSLQAAQRAPNSILYRGKLRQCVPLGAGYFGISYNGTFCKTVGKVEFSARVNSRQQVEYNFPDGRVEGHFRGRLHWTLRTI